MSTSPDRAVTELASQSYMMGQQVQATRDLASNVSRLEERFNHMHEMYVSRREFDTAVERLEGANIATNRSLSSTNTDVRELLAARPRQALLEKFMWAGMAALASGGSVFTYLRF